MHSRRPKYLFLVDDGWRIERRELLYHLRGRVDFDVVTHDESTVRHLGDDFKVIKIQRYRLRKNIWNIVVMFFARELDTRLLATARRLRFHRLRWYLKVPYLLRIAADRLGLRRYTHHQASKYLYRNSDKYGELLANYDGFVYSPVNHIDHRIVYEAMRGGLKVVCHVYSWDNPMKENEFPNDAYRYFVWNEECRQDVVRLHGAPEDRIDLVGPIQFDYLIEGRRRKDSVPRGAYVLFACSVATYDFHIEQEIRIVRMIRRVLDQVAPTTKLLVRPYPFTGRENPCDCLGGEAGIEILSFRTFEEGLTLFSSQDLKDRFDQLQGAACFVNFGSTMALEASFTDTPIIQINFNPPNEFKPWQDIGEILRNDHLRYVIDTSFPNVVSNEDELKRALAEILFGRADPYRAFSEKLQRFADPLGADSYKEIFCTRLLDL